MTDTRLVNRHYETGQVEDILHHLQQAFYPKHSLIQRINAEEFTFFTDHLPPYYLLITRQFAKHKGERSTGTFNEIAEELGLLWPGYKIEQDLNSLYFRMQQFMSYRRQEHYREAFNNNIDSSWAILSLIHELQLRSLKIQRTIEFHSSEDQAILQYLFRYFENHFRLNYNNVYINFNKREILVESSDSRNRFNENYARMENFYKFMHEDWISIFNCLRPLYREILEYASQGISRNDIVLMQFNNQPDFVEMSTEVRTAFEDVLYVLGRPQESLQQSLIDLQSMAQQRTIQREEKYMRSHG